MKQYLGVEEKREINYVFKKLYELNQSVSKRGLVLKSERGVEIKRVILEKEAKGGERESISKRKEEEKEGGSEEKKGREKWWPSKKQKKGAAALLLKGI